MAVAEKASVIFIFISVCMACLLIFSL